MFVSVCTRARVCVYARARVCKCVCVCGWDGTPYRPLRIRFTHVTGYRSLGCRESTLPLQRSKYGWPVRSEPKDSETRTKDHLSFEISREVTICLFIYVKQSNDQIKGKEWLMLKVLFFLRRTDLKELDRRSLYRSCVTNELFIHYLVTYLFVPLLRRKSVRFSLLFI